MPLPPVNVTHGRSHGKVVAKDSRRAVWRRRTLHSGAITLQLHFACVIHAVFKNVICRHQAGGLQSMPAKLYVERTTAEIDAPRERQIQNNQPRRQTDDLTCTYLLQEPGDPQLPPMLTKTDPA